MSVPHFSMPLRFIGGRAVTSEQGSQPEIADCVANICRYQTGQRPEKPSFGIPEQAFVQGGPDVGLLAATVSGQEPRAAIAGLLDASQLEELVAAVTLAVTDKGAAA